jgi:hypothetical protein
MKMLPTPNSEPIDTTTDGSCIDNGEDNAKAGAEIFYDEGNPNNMAIRVPNNIQQSNQTGEVVAIAHWQRAHHLEETFEWRATQNLPLTQQPSSVRKEKIKDILESQMKNWLKPKLCDSDKERRTLNLNGLKDTMETPEMKEQINLQMKGQGNQPPTTLISEFLMN